ncbi:MAG: hypothetical protein DI635_00505 [Pseudoxanthomonas suwonensis]|nr:MAG: hypothetical protein DI635_00505 [Pseudoxanthomonas suwonensis]
MGACAIVVIVIPPPDHAEWRGPPMNAVYGPYPFSASYVINLDARRRSQFARSRLYGRRAYIALP